MALWLGIKYQQHETNQRMLLAIEFKLEQHLSDARAEWGRHKASEDSARVELMTQFEMAKLYLQKIEVVLATNGMPLPSMPLELRPEEPRRARSP
jgi:hypothetical protein